MATEIQSIRSMYPDIADSLEFSEQQPEYQYTLREELAYYAPIVAVMGSVALAAEKIALGEVYPAATIACAVGATAFTGVLVKVIGR